MKLIPVILAAGQGTRMNSSLPKVLHTIGGQPMLQHVIDSCRDLTDEKIVIVYGHEGEKVQNLIGTGNDGLAWAHQKDQMGTGHAVQQAHEHIDDDAIIVIAYGDVPLIKTKTLQDLAEKVQSGAVLSILTTILENPQGYGRIVRDKQNNIRAIVEEKDATNVQRKISEVNTGFIATKGKNLKRWLDKLSPDNTQGEYYLTDCILLAANECNGDNNNGDHNEIVAVICEDSIEVQGVNNRIQQAQLERAYQHRQAEQLMLAGVTLIDPKRCDVRGTLTAGKDVTIDINTVFIGTVILGNHVNIEPGCVIRDSQIEDNVTIKAHSVIESASIGKNCEVGPFARIRPDTVLKENARVGNFVEIKKSIVGKGSKVSHLSYIGDTVMGEDVNIGAGTITCNYDGANKFQTTIGNRVFVGSDTQLVAPVTVHDGATIGAGSTITKDTPENELTLSRAKQITINGWQRPPKLK